MLNNKALQTNPAIGRTFYRQSPVAEGQKELFIGRNLIFIRDGTYSFIKDAG